MDSSVKTLGNSNMLSKIGYNITKTKFGRKIWSEIYLLLPLYINRPTKKKLPTKRILKTIDSSVRNLGEVEYDKQNWLQHQKPQVWTNNSKWGLPPIATVHKSVHNKIFPNWNNSRPERTDSSIRNLGEVKYDEQNWLQHHETQVVNHGKVRKTHWSHLECNFATWCCSQFCISCSTSPRFLMLE